MSDFSADVIGFSLVGVIAGACVSASISFILWDFSYFTNTLGAALRIGLVVGFFFGLAIAIREVESK